MRVAVFCSCSEDVSPFFLSEIEQLGEELVRLGHEVVYGGSTAGCMGALAKGVLNGGGHLVGVIPQMHFMDGKQHEALGEEIIVPNMSDRKVCMIENSDAFLIFPGGIGTLDEAFEVLALKNIGAVSGPVLFYNYMGTYTPLIEAMQLMVEQRLIRRPLPELFRVLDKVGDLGENLINAV